MGDAYEFAFIGRRPILMVLALAIVTGSMPAHAQQTWRLDPQLSIARLSLGSASNALEIGLARVSGNVVFDSNDHLSSRIASR